MADDFEELLRFVYTGRVKIRDADAHVRLLELGRRWSPLLLDCLSQPNQHSAVGTHDLTFILFEVCLKRFHIDDEQLHFLGSES